jgi:uncharacterized protein
MRTSRKNIDTFLQSQKIAVAGVSRDPKKFGFQVFTDLKKKGFEVFAVNPNMETVNGNVCYASVSALPADVKSLLVLTRRDRTAGIVRDAVARGMDNIWIQQMSETEEAVGIAEEARVNLVAKKCILMFLQPVTGFHKFHRTLMKIFGRLPK